MLSFECFRKRGRGWQYLGEYTAPDSKVAARRVSAAHRVAFVGVRPAGTQVKLYTYRFKLHDRTA